MEIKFEPFKTRQQIADELNMSARSLRELVKESKLQIGHRKRLGIQDQICIYSILLGKRSLLNTEYEKYMHDKIS